MCRAQEIDSFNWTVRFFLVQNMPLRPYSESCYLDFDADDSCSKKSYICLSLHLAL